MLCQIYLPKTIRQCGQLSSSPLGSLTHLWWAVYQYDHPQIEKNSSKNEMLIFGLHSTSDDRPSNLSNEKCLKCGIMATKSSKNEMLVLDYIQLLMIGQAIWVTKVDWNAKKGPLSHQKMKCSFLDYVQFLMISRAIWATKVDQNGKKLDWKTRWHFGSGKYYSM